MIFFSTDPVNTTGASEEMPQELSKSLSCYADISVADTAVSDTLTFYEFLFFTAHQSSTVHVCFRAKHIKVIHGMKMRFVHCTI